MDELERQLVRIWEVALGRQGIGLRDSFWDLGGTSLIALRVVRRIEEVLGKSVPVATLLQVSTIEELASLLRASGWPSVWSSLVALQLGGSRPPFFCVHGMGGVVIRLRDLARHLRPEQPVFGLQAQGIDGTQPALTRIEEMASHYLREIRTVQSHGPYYLGGVCFGGWVAYEMAQQLRRQRQEVAFLGLLGTYRVNWSKRSLALKLLRLPPRESLAHIFRKARREVLEARANVETLFLRRPLKQVRKALDVASHAYVPQPYSGKITLFRASQKSVRDPDDPSSGWGDLAGGGLEIHSVAGDHDTIFMEPELSVLAGQLELCLEIAQDEASRKQAPSPEHDKFPLETMEPLQT